MQTIIIDDEQAAIKMLRKLLLNYCPEVEVIAEANNIQDAKSLIENLKPELIFLDVEMPQGTGFDLLQNLSNINFKVIFTTAHEKYALQAIKFSALDYLLKPIDPEELINAVDKAKNEIERELSNLKVQTLLQNLQKQDKDEQTIILKDKYGVHFIKIQDIIRLEAGGSYTQFVFTDRNPILISRLIKEYDTLLTPHGFFRCHKSHLININYLLSYVKNDGDYLILKGGSKIPLATRKKDDFMKIISQKGEIK